MPPLSLVLVGCALLGVLVITAAVVWLRLIGADLNTARRLGGARELTVAETLDLAGAPARAVRVAGRIRCADPLVTPDGDQLVAFHRDVEVRLPSGRWRTVERVRETRSFELWDHGGSLTVDLAAAAEPLITIPLAWEGAPDELEGPHAAAVARLAAEGLTPVAARAVTRSIPIVDRLLVLARVSVGPGGAVHLEPPPGGYLISSLELDAAMRLLGGPRRRQLAFAIGSLVVGAALFVAGLAGGSIAWLASR